MRGECPDPQPDCKYAPDCFSDTDHIYGRGKGMGSMVLRFCNLPENKRQICRRLHDEINATYVHLPLPDIDFIKEALNRHRHKQSS